MGGIRNPCGTVLGEQFFPLAIGLPPVTRYIYIYRVRCGCGAGGVDHGARQRAGHQHDRLAPRLPGRPAQHAGRREPRDQTGGRHRSV